MHLWCTINQERSESHRVPSAQWKWQVKGVELWGEKPLEKCARSQTCLHKGVDTDKSCQGLELGTVEHTALEAEAGGSGVQGHP